MGILFIYIGYRLYVVASHYALPDEPATQGDLEGYIGIAWHTHLAVEGEASGFVFAQRLEVRSAAESIYDSGVGFLIMF